MKYDPEKHHRQSLRLRYYDYSLEGAYFITICTQHRANLFGAVEHGISMLNQAGVMIEKHWNELESKFPQVELGTKVVMPNHFHGILRIHATRDQNRVCLSEIVQWFKTMTTNAYIRGVKLSGWKPFDGKIWQRSYHDHIIL